MRKRSKAKRRSTVPDTTLSSRSRTTTVTVWPITRALRPILEARGDPAVVDALDTIESLCLTVSTKTFRASRA